MALPWVPARAWQHRGGSRRELSTLYNDPSGSGHDPSRFWLPPLAGETNRSPSAKVATAFLNAGPWPNGKIVDEREAAVALRRRNAGPDLGFTKPVLISTPRREAALMNAFFCESPQRFLR